MLAAQQAAATAERSIETLRADLDRAVSMRRSEEEKETKEKEANEDLSSAVARAVAEESARCAAQAQAEMERLRRDLEQALAAERKAASCALRQALEEEGRRAAEERCVGTHTDTCILMTAAYEIFFVGYLFVYQ